MIHTTSAANAAIVVRSNPDGSVLRLQDVARVELGAETYSFISRYNGKPATGLAISLALLLAACAPAATVDRADATDTNSAACVEKRGCARSSPGPPSPRI